MREFFARAISASPPRRCDTHAQSRVEHRASLRVSEHRNALDLRGEISCEVAKRRRASSALSPKPALDRTAASVMNSKSQRAKEGGMVTRRTVLQHAGSIALAGSVPSWVPSARGSGGGFTAARGVTTSGTFADGEAFSFHVAAGGLGARVNPLWLVYYPFEKNFATHPTLSRLHNTMFPSTTNTVISTLHPPTNASGSVAYIPVHGGGYKASAFSNNGATAQMLCDLHSTGPGFKMYSFQKRRWDFASNPANDKMFRVWPNPDSIGYPNGYFAWTQSSGEHNANIELPGTHTGLGEHSNFVPAMPGPLLHTWHTDEFYAQEGSANHVDGIWNWARQGVMAYALAGRWLMNATGRNPPQNSNMLRGTFLDEITNAPPNGTTDTARTGITVIDDSWLQLILTDETGGVYHWGQTKTAEAFVSNREAQPQTLRTNTDVTVMIRKGSFSSLSGISAYAITGYGTAMYLGVGS